MSLVAIDPSPRRGLGSIAIYIIGASLSEPHIDEVNARNPYIREDVSTSMGRASANPTQVLWYTKSGIFNRLVLCSDNISQLSYLAKLLNSYDCAYVPIVSGCSS